ncbi:YraN family protein [Metallibacterium scheffleri]|uniref:YraN family protein n=1 Tax=Metallibacterium scheffleri TaxID=993689 RepID=UPI0030DA58FC
MSLATPTPRQRLGAAAETAALARLESAGLKPLARNFRSRYGEIDLIMLDGTTLVFVEVRARGNPLGGGALASVGTAKQGRFAARRSGIPGGVSGARAAHLPFRCSRLRGPRQCGALRMGASGIRNALTHTRRAARITQVALYRLAHGFRSSWSRRARPARLGLGAADRLGHTTIDPDRTGQPDVRREPGAKSAEATTGGTMI